MSNPDWDHLLQHSSAIGLLMPDAFFDNFGLPPEADVPRARLVRTVHGPNGLSVFASDDYLAPVYPHGPGAAAFALADRRAAVPVTLTPDDVHFAGPYHGPTSPACPPTGAVLVLADVPPLQAAAPLRRTRTLDYAVVLSGEIVLRLDSGAETTVRAGELIVQQGTKQAWENRSALPCRILCVMLASDRIVLPGGGVLASP